MKGDPHPATLRLCAQLPVRTHERTRQDYADRLSANNLRAVQVRGVTYESLTEAGRQLGRSRGSIRNMIKYGLARYV